VAIRLTRSAEPIVRTGKQDKMESGRGLYSSGKAEGRAKRVRKKNNSSEDHPGLSAGEKGLF
jgi:hypothetical protein